MIFGVQSYYSKNNVTALYIQLLTSNLMVTACDSIIVSVKNTIDLTEAIPVDRLRDY